MPLSRGAANRPATAIAATMSTSSRSAGTEGIALLVRTSTLRDSNGPAILASAALGMLITLHKKVQEQQGELKLSNINKQIYQVFRITRPV